MRGKRAKRLGKSRAKRLGKPSRAGSTVDLPNLTFSEAGLQRLSEIPPKASADLATPTPGGAGIVLTEPRNPNSVKLEGV